MDVLAPEWPGDPRRAPRRFATTRWSLVSKAASGPGGGEALAALCRAYWHPVHAFIQGHGLTPEDAADVTQSLFEKLLARNDIACVDRARGQFRCWLRTCARNHLYNWFAHRRGAAVGGNALHVSMDCVGEELRDERTPESSFDRRWALMVLERSLARLRHKYERANKTALYSHLHLSLSGAPGQTSDQELAVLLGKTVGAIKVERHRLRRRFQECLRAEVADTLTDPTDVDDEIRRLIDALA